MGISSVRRNAHERAVSDVLAIDQRDQQQLPRLFFLTLNKADLLFQCQGDFIRLSD